MPGTSDLRQSDHSRADAVPDLLSYHVKRRFMGDAIHLWRDMPRCLAEQTPQLKQGSVQ